MHDGGNIISPAIAKDNAQQMIRIANELRDLLDNVSTKFDEINNEQTGVYFGEKKPSELKQELDEFKGVFGKVHGQITKSANDIINIANTMENE